MKFLKTAFCLCVSAALISSGSTFAFEKTAKGAAGGKGKPKKLTAQQFIPKGMELSEEQTKKFEEIEQEFGPKLAAAQKASHDVLTKEQHKARHEAVKAAKAAGLKKLEAKESVEKAVTLTDEQKKQLEEADKTLSTLRAEIGEKVKALLTDEQKEKLKAGKKGKLKGDATPTTEPAKTEPAKTEAPKVEAPKTEAPKT